ncbi:MAG: hypothetical protein MZV63_33485 [Marinilabiliales bacterium]|nr:hypothetical protein [Marinilabiliales bacterium]
MTIAFLQRDSVRYPLLVEINIPAVGPGDPDDLWCDSANNLNLAAFYQRFFSIMALGDIEHHAHGADDPAGSIPEMLASFVDEADLAGVFAHNPVIDLIAVGAILYRVGIGRVDRAVLRVN